MWLIDRQELKRRCIKRPRYENLRFACASLYDDVSIMELTSTLLALHSLCDVLVIDCQTGHFALGRELLGREDVRLIVTRPDDVSIRAERAYDDEG